MKLFSTFDWSIFVCILLLFGFSLSTINSVAPSLIISQLIFCFLGLCLFFLFAVIDYRIYQPLSKLIYFASLILLGTTLFLGFESHGAIRWIAIGSFRFQFSEILKPFFIVSLASFLLNIPKRNFLRFIFLIGILFVPILMVFKQPDLGSALVFSLGALVMIFISEVSLLYLLASLILAALSLPVLWFILADYQKKRILTYLSPEIDPLGSSYNAIQSIITVGSGMLFGKGIGRGTQSHLSFLPEHHTDFIFASISEELGFVGSSAVVLIYFVLIWRIFRLCSASTDPYARLISGGIAGFILVQAFINIGMNIGLVPVTGITLPLVSYGGSSVLATMIGLGIVENIAISQKSQDRLHIGK